MSAPSTWPLSLLWTVVIIIIVIVVIVVLLKLVFYIIGIGPIAIDNGNGIVESLKWNIPL